MGECLLFEIHLKGVGAIEVGADDALEPRCKVAFIVYTMSPSVMLLKMDEHLIEQVLIELMRDTHLLVS